MSARVFNPSAAMELRRAVRSGQGEAAAALLSFAAAGPASVPASVPAPALERVRRNLFGAVNHEETRKFVERELAAQSERDQTFYEFDFSRGVPRDGSSRRFLWERVSVGSVPESYALRRLAYLSAATVDAQQHQQAAPAAVAEAAAAAAARARATAIAAAAASAAGSSGPATPGPSSQPPCTPAPARTRQTQINDFMRARKRPGTCPSTSVKTATTAPTSSSKSGGDGGSSNAKQRKSSTATV